MRTASTQSPNLERERVGKSRPEELQIRLDCGQSELPARSLSLPSGITTHRLEPLTRKFQAPVKSGSTWRWLPKRGKRRSEREEKGGLY